MCRFLCCLQSTAVVLWCKLSDADYFISAGISMTLEVVSGCHTECSHQYNHTTVTQAFGSMSPDNMNKSIYSCNYCSEYKMLSSPRIQKVKSYTQPNQSKPKNKYIPGIPYGTRNLLLISGTSYVTTYVSTWLFMYGDFGRDA